MITVTVNVNDAGLRQAVASIGADLAQRERLHTMMATPLEDITRTWLERLGAARHTTANRLQATPSGHWSKAAEGVRSGGDAEGAWIYLYNAAGISRAFKDITIRPGAGKSYLTIPLHPLAYNRRARDFPGELVPISSGKGDFRRRFLAIKRDGVTDGPLEVAYLLTPVIHQKQDRTLLPSDALYGQAAVVGITAWWERVTTQSA